MLRCTTGRVGAYTREPELSCARGDGRWGVSHETGGSRETAAPYAFDLSHARPQTPPSAPKRARDSSYILLAGAVCDATATIGGVRCSSRKRRLFACAIRVRHEGTHAGLHSSNYRFQMMPRGGVEMSLVGEGEMKGR